VGMVHPAYASQRRRDHTDLGVHPDTGDVLQITDIDMRSSTYLLGKAGTGKSSELENIIIQHIKKRKCVIFIDPHGDSVDHIVSMVPRELVANIYLLDMLDEAWPFGINVLNVGKIETEVQLAQVIDSSMHIFEVLWPDVLAQANLPRYLRMAIIVLLNNQPSTLVDLYRFLRKPELRAQMLKQVHDETVLEFWAAHDNMKLESQLVKVQPLLGKLESLFAGRGLVRNIVGQKVSSINWRQVMLEGKTILIKLPVTIAKQDARLIGTFILAQIQAAIFGLSDLPDEQRPDTFLGVDEVQNFGVPDLGRLVTEARKYHSLLVVGHQYRDQLPEFLKEPTMACRTICCFRVTPDDAREMAQLFHDTKPTIKPEDMSRNAVRDLQHMGSGLPKAVQTFVQTYLHGLKGDGDVKVQHVEASLVRHLLVSSEPEKVRLRSPVSALDDLFLRVMQTGNPNLPIPEVAVMGLANGGHAGFYTTSWFDRLSADWLTKPLEQFPGHYVWKTAEGWEWGRQPQDKVEQLIHCLGHLRITMHHLAQNPIGKATTGSANVAQLLSQLPPRHAFVQTSDGVWYMKTQDTPPPCDAEEFKARMYFIEQQTHQQYCHPRSEIESKPVVQSEPEPENFNEPPEHNGWEDI
jgi:hypothetical protein